MSDVPKWNQLPSAAQRDLAHWKTWYSGNRTSDKSRLTLLNVFVRLKATNLWQYVKVACPIFWSKLIDRLLHQVGLLKAHGIGL